MSAEFVFILIYLSRQVVLCGQASDTGYAYYKPGLAGQWPVFRVLSAIGRRMARQRWPMAEDPLDSSLVVTRLVMLPLHW